MCHYLCFKFYQSMFLQNIVLFALQLGRYHKNKKVNFLLRYRLYTARNIHAISIRNNFLGRGLTPSPDSIPLIRETAN